MWAINIPIISGILLFVIKSIYDEYQRRQTTYERLGNELIYTADRMIRIACELEYYYIQIQFHHQLTILYAKDDQKYKYNDEQANHYLRNGDAGKIRYESLKSDLKKNIKDFNKYWKNDTEKKLILDALNRVSFIHPRNFNNEFSKIELNHKAISDHYIKIREGVSEHIFLNSVGLHLIFIQRIIDQETPILYVKRSLKDRMNELLKDYNTIAAKWDKENLL